MNFKPTGRYIVTDDKWFVFVLEQLISNALKYTKKGQISIYMKEKSLVIEDTGIGIPEDQKERIFERFYRVDKSHSREIGGTGLGLSIVKHGAILPNAKINVDSELGKGTRMKLPF